MTYNHKKSITFPSFAYQITVGIVGAYLIYLVAPEWSMNLLPLYIVWGGFSTAAELKPVTMPNEDQLTVSFAVHIAALILFGSATAILISTISNVIVDALGKRGIKKMVFNVSQYAITIYLSAMVYQYFAADLGHLNLHQNILAMLLSCLTYVIINYVIVSIIVSITQEARFIKVLTRDVKLELLHFCSLVPVSILIVILYSVEPWSVLIVLLPLGVAQYSFENYITLRTQTKTTFEVLADIVDKRDAYTAEHSLRVAEFCNKISEELFISHDQKEALVTAAKVHDLGKIAIPDEILLKKGRLDDSEMEVMKSHALMGYKIINNLRFYRYCANLVLYHHERFDGKGYPYGIRGDKIPLGARILAVADSYDAMTTDRPYRKALPDHVALEELRKCSGSQFDPAVVDAFMKVKQREASSE